MVAVMISVRPLIFALAAFGLALGVAQAGTRPIVVELYTSQGCSSCPPADANLGKLAQRPGLIAISLPVTYWDMLGWKDTLAREDYPRRQKAYAAAMGHGGVYTPQVIVDGVSDVVGSRAAEIEAAIAERRAQLAQAMADDPRIGAHALPAALGMARPATMDPVVPVALTETGQDMHIDIGAVPGVDGATVWMFHLRSTVSVNIARGENTGHTVTYHNVASDLKAVGVYKGRALSLTLPRASGVPHDAIAVIVQKGGFGHVLGAAYLSRPDYYAQQ